MNASLTPAQITAREILTAAEPFDSGLYPEPGHYVDLHGARREGVDLLWTLGAFEGEAEVFGHRLTNIGEILREMALQGL